MSAESQPVACPKGNHSEQVQKVVELFKDKKISRKSILGSQLLPPPKPGYTLPWLSTLLLLGLFFLFLLLIFGCVHYSDIVLILPLPLLFASEEIKSDPDYFPMLIVSWILLILFILLITSAVVLFFGSIIRFVFKIQSARENLQTALVKWERAKENWEYLFYCQRHDIVFDPRESNPIPIARNRILEYLYR